MPTFYHFSAKSNALKRSEKFDTRNKNGYDFVGNALMESVL